MTERKIISINSTNEQFQTSDQAGFKVSKRLERKPLIGERPSGGDPHSGAPLSSTSTNQPGVLHDSFTEPIPPLPDSPPSSAINSSGRTLKTAGGVFAPVALSQFSSLLFLRLGYLVGYAGLPYALGLLTGAYMILLVTVLSICAISTNGAVEGGGAYFMISRTLGPEIGGAVGLVFYIANVFSCALCTSGCVEGLLQGITIAVYPDQTNFSYIASNVTNTTQSLPLDHGEIYLISVGVNLFLLICCLVGANMFAKSTSVFFGTVCAITFVVFLAMMLQSDIVIPYARSNAQNTTEHAGNFTGPSLETIQNNSFPHYNIDYTTGNVVSLMSVFGVMFSGITGIMAGANMSGELMNPGYSIPRGTIGACVFTFFVYAAMMIATGFTTSNDVLLNNYVFMSYISFWEPLVYIGIVMATLCASMSNMIGASRILAAIAGDKVFGRTFVFLSYVNRCCNNEFLGPLLTTFLLSACVLSIGNMNAIAPYSSTFFLLSYAALNLSCMMLIWSGAPNFRPMFRHYCIWTCALGLLANVVIMMVLNTAAAIVCIVTFGVLLGFLYYYHLKYPNEEMQWGSVAQGILFHTVRKYLLKLDFRREHVKFWRPHLLLLVSNPRSAGPLIDTLNDLKKSGIYILGHVRVSDQPPQDLHEEYNKWQEMIDHLKVKAFVSITESKDLRAGAVQLARVSGLGALKPNTVLLGFRDNQPQIDFISMESSRYHMKNTPGSWYPVKEHASAASEQDFSRITKHAYVAMLQDILYSGKNIALCRSFQLLDKEKITRRSTGLSNVDVWPINFMCPEKSTVDDTTSLFTLQLGTVLKMVKFWRKHTGFRVFLMVPQEWTVDFLREQEKKVQETLRSVRIDAEIVKVTWTLPADALPLNKVPTTSGEQQPVDAFGWQSPATTQFTRTDGASSGEATASLTDDANAFGSSTGSSTSSTCETSLQLMRLTGRYLSAVNKSIKEFSKNAAVTFLNIPPPPAITDNYDMYLDALSRLTEDIGPSIMVHGISKVTTTML